MQESPNNERFDVTAELSSVEASASPSDASGSRAAQVDQRTIAFTNTVPNSSPASPAPASIGRYRITGVLGAGGFATVYRAIDTELEREVAIKLSSRHDASDADAYLTEARNVAKLDHPGIAPVFDSGRAPDGRYFIVSKLALGGSLNQEMQKRRLTATEAALLIADVAEALHHAHKHGLIHRDIKPGNILLDDQGHPLLADFGVAIADHEFGKEEALLGTPAYMSPEQARHEGHTADARSDIYSLGVVLYELLTGRTPYRSQTVVSLLDEMVSVESRPPRQLDDAIPEALDRICIRALAKRPADRYSTALDFATELRAAAAPRAATAPRAGKFGWRAAAAVATIAAALIAPAVLIPRYRDVPPPAGPAAAAKDLSLELHYQRAGENEVFHLLSDGAAPLADGDKVQVHVRGDWPQFLYVYWYDQHGKPQRLWPTDPHAQVKTATLSLPTDRDQWFSLNGGKGNEMVMIAASDTPRDAADLAEFENQESFTPEQRVISSPLALTAETVAEPESVQRGIDKTVTSRKTPVSKQYVERLQTKFARYRGLVFPHD